MPRELGKAKRADITGHFPGERAEHGSALAGFLQDSGRLAPLQDGSGLDDPSHGKNGVDKEVAGQSTGKPGSDADTEIGLNAADLGHPSDSAVLFDDDALSPVPMMTPDAGDPRAESTGELEPVEWEPSADTLSPDEPQALNSVPDLTSPELDMTDEQEDSSILDETDKLPPRRSGLPTFKPEPHEVSARAAPADSGDTGILEPAQPAPDRVDMAELDPMGEEDTGITIEPELATDDRITSKVKPRGESRQSQHGRAMRDTVNFYNQTQNLYESKAPQSARDAAATPIGERDTRPLERVADPNADGEDAKITRPLNIVDPEADRRPQKPTGTVDKRGVDTLEPVADQHEPIERDTQRFHVAEVLSAEDTPGTGDTTANLQPAQEGLPDTARSSSESTHPDMATESGRIEHEDLPEPTQVNADFEAAFEEAPSARIIPEYISLEPEGDGYSEEVSDSNRITTRVDSSPLLGRDTDRPLAEPPQRNRADETPVVPIPVNARARDRHMTESLSRRLREERAATRRMIEQAEAIVVKLREAAEQSREDLVTMSERRAAAASGGNGHGRAPAAHDTERVDTPHSEGGTTLYDPPAAGDDEARSRPDGERERRTRRRRERVSTRDIGGMIRELERAAAREPASLSALLESPSLRRPAPVHDADLLLTASARMRATLKRDLEEEAAAERTKQTPSQEFDERRERNPVDETYNGAKADGNGRSSRHSPLAQDLDRLWDVLDARRMPAVVLPPSERARTTQRDEDEHEGWTQEALWGTLVGIAGVTFILGGLFVWVLFKLLT